MLRILVEARFLSAAPHSSIARYVGELVEAWADLPDGPSVALYGPGPRPSGLRTTERIVWRSPPAFATRLGRQTERGRLWLNTFFAATALLERPDVIFFPWPFVPHILKSPTVITMHDLCYRAYPHHYTDSGQSLDARARAAAQRAQEVIAVSQACKNGVIETYGIDPNRITVVHHGVSRLFKPQPTPTDGLVSQRYGLSAPYLLCVSTHDPRKNLESLIQAFVALVDDFSPGAADPPMLVLVGKKSDYTSRLRSLVARSPRSEARLIFIENLTDDELAALYRRATAVVLPSLCEGFGFPLLEAVLSGTPAVASDLSVFHELVGDACLYVPPTEVAAWTEALARVVARQCELREKTRAAAQQLLDRYSWHSTAIRTLDVLTRAAVAGRTTPQSGSHAPLP